MTLSRVKRPNRHLNMRLWFEKLILVVFVIGCHQSFGRYEAEVQQLINSLTTTYCPYTDLCQSNASQVLKEKEASPCCDDCDCANDCWKKGNCCPDKHNATKQSPTTVCQTTLVKGTSDHDNFDKYWVVKKCPETTSNATVAKKCKGISLKSIKDYLWVSDLVTNRIYNNKWCADCYNITNFVEWRASTECIQILNGKNPIDEKGSLNNECNLIVVPPEGIDAANELCRKPDISKCNRTGQWMEYNGTLEKACEAFELLFYEEHLFGQTVYKNIFCAMCNEQYKRPKDVGRVCKPRVLRERTGRGGRFVGLIDWRFYKQPKSRGEVCALDEVDDKFMRKCRKLSCPMLSAPFHGTCKRIMEATSRLRIGVLYRIEPMWEWANLQQSDMTLVSLEKLGYGMIKQFERELGLDARDCTRCEAWVDAAEYSVGFKNMSMPEYFIVHIEYMTNKFCGENTIASALLNIRGTKMQVESSHGLTITISAELETRPIEQVLNSTIAIFGAIVTMACFDVFYIDLTKTKLCPAITLTDEDYIDIIKRPEIAPEIKQVNSLFGVENFTEVQIKKTVICLDDYRAVISDINANVLNKAVKLRHLWVHTITAIFFMLSYIA